MTIIGLLHDLSHDLHVTEFISYNIIGTVRYIGKLEFDILDLVYIGIHLDLPGAYNK